jgi:drug/metabolite transporter (DMT)-like permease
LPAPWGANNLDVTANNISIPNRNIYTGIALAVLATLIWSGNFIIARGVATQIPPVSLAFYRWLLASLLLLPIAFRKFNQEKSLVSRHLPYMFWVALTGISLFNTFLYVAAHYTTAINLALIGTTSSPVFAIILAAIFLKERVGLLRILGLLLCISGILMLLTGGDAQKLLTLQFTTGDGWVLLAALFFAIYNTLVRRKPAAISALTFLFTSFAMGTVVLFPFYLYETMHTPAVVWNTGLFAAILYLGAGTSVVAYLCWNLAIGKLGAARTALFGNLIPLFSIIEAVIFLNEEFTRIHLFSGLLIIAGLVMANLRNTTPSLVTSNKAAHVS